MKVLVPIKRVVDYNVKIRVKADRTGVEAANVNIPRTLLTKSPSRRQESFRRSWLYP